MVRQSIWKKTVGAPKGKRGIETVPVIPWLGRILDAITHSLAPKLVTKEGDLVMDPFAGSNTTGAVAQRLKRKWIGVEAKRGVCQKL